MYEVQGIHREYDDMNVFDDPYAWEYTCKPRALAVLNVAKKYGAIVDGNCHSVFCPVHGGEERAEIARNITMYANMHHMYEFVTFTHSSDLKSPEAAEQAYEELKAHFGAIMEQAKNLKFAHYLGQKRFRNKRSKKTDEQYYLEWLRWVDQVTRYEYITNFRRVARAAVEFAVVKRRIELDVKATYTDIDVFLNECYEKAMTGDEIAKKLRERYVFLKKFRKLDEALENVRAKIQDYLTRLSDHDEYKFPSSGAAIGRYVLDGQVMSCKDKEQEVRTAEIENETKNHVNQKIHKLSYIGTWEVGKGGHLHIHALVNFPVFSYIIEKSKWYGETMQVYDVQSVDRTDPDALSDYMTKLGRYHAKTDMEDVKRLTAIGIFGHRHTDKGITRGKSVYFSSDRDIQVRTYHHSKNDEFDFTGFVARRNKMDKIGAVRNVDIDREMPVFSKAIDDGISQEEAKKWFGAEAKMIVADYHLRLSQNQTAKRIWAQVQDEYSDELFRDMCGSATTLTREQMFSALREIQYVEFIARYAEYRAGLTWQGWVDNYFNGKVAGASLASVDTATLSHSFTTEQMGIVYRAVDYPEIVVKADGGSGKTYTLVNFLNKTPFDPSKVAVLSYTASVTQKLCGELDARYSSSVQTVDAFLQMRRRVGKTVYGQNYHNVHSEIEVVIIDEFERLTPEKKALLYMSLPENVRILNFGDMGQIGAFGHKFGAIENLPGVGLFKLTKNFRTREGFQNHGEEYIGDFAERKDEIVQAVLAGTKVLTNVHRIRRLVNQWVLEELDKMGQRGTARIRVGGHVFADGDQVVIKRNRKHADDERFNSLNGEEGFIRVFMGGHVQYAPFVDGFFDEAMIAVELANGKGIRFFRHDELLRYTDTIQHAYAITIQSSQGKEYEDVLVLLAKTRQEHRNKYFASREMLYTGVSRARSGVKVITNLAESEYQEYTAENASYDYMDYHTLNEKDIHSDHAVLLRTIRFVVRERYLNVA